MALILADLRGEVFACSGTDVIEPTHSLESLQGFELLKLPLEIRSLIWRHLFKVREKPLVVNKRNKNLYIAPILLCKTLHHEIIDLVFQESNVEVHPNPNFRFMLHNLDAQARAYIRKLTYLEGYFVNFINDWVTLVLDCHQLKILHVSLSDRRKQAEYTTLVSDSAWFIQHHKSNQGQNPCRLQVTCSTIRHLPQSADGGMYKNETIERVFQSGSNRARGNFFTLPSTLEEFHIAIAHDFCRDTLMQQTFDGQWVWGTLEPDHLEPMRGSSVRIISTCEWLPAPAPSPKTPIRLPKKYDDWRIGGP